MRSRRRARPLMVQLRGKAIGGRGASIAMLKTLARKFGGCRQTRDYL